MSLIDEQKLITPNERFKEGFPELEFNETNTLKTLGEPILITDPTYLADVYNSQDEAAEYVRKHGIIVYDFGGDTSCPVWWQPPYIILPISLHLAKNMITPSDVTILAHEVGCDSGSFVFLSFNESLPQTLKEKINTIVKENNGALVKVPEGTWQVFYEQHKFKDTKMPETFYRNIIVKVRNHDDKTLLTS